MKARLFVSFATIALAATSAGAQGMIPSAARRARSTVSEFLTRPARRRMRVRRRSTSSSTWRRSSALPSRAGTRRLARAVASAASDTFPLGLRVNAVQGSLPQVQDVTPSVQGAQSTQFDTKTQIIPMPTADLAIGIFKGLPLAITNVGGIDLLLSAAYLPEFDEDGVTVKVPDGSLKIGYGARVGIIQESLLTPGISVSYLQRDLPTVSVAGASGNDSLYVNNLKLKTKAWRVVASKSLLFIGLAAGAGQDKYESSTDIGAHVAARTVPPTPAVNMNPTGISQSITRTNVFANLSMNLLLLKLTGEIGQVSGGTINTFNTFSGKQAADSRIYGSVGARFGF